MSIGIHPKAVEIAAKDLMVEDGLGAPSRQACDNVGDIEFAGCHWTPILLAR